MPTVRRVNRRPKPAAAYDEDDDLLDDEEEKRPRRRTVKPKPALQKPASNGTRRARHRDDDEEESDDGILSKIDRLPSGFSGFKNVKNSLPSRWTKTLRPEQNEDVLIKFLESEPFVSFSQHWAQWMPQGKGKSFICLKSFGEEDCPLCDLPDNASPPMALARFNVAKLATRGEDGEPVELETPELWAWDAGIGMVNAIERIISRRNNPSITYGYWIISNIYDKKTKKSKYDITPIKDRDVEDPDEWGVNILTKDEISVLKKKLYDKTSIYPSSYEELEEVAKIKRKLVD